MPSNTRAENQYYGKYFECCIAAHLNNSEVEYHEDYDFTTEEQKNLLEEAKIVARHIGNHTATYLGNQLECEFGGNRCFGIAANMDFLLVCTYEENGENPELVVYKKR